MRQVAAVQPSRKRNRLPPSPMMTSHQAASNSKAAESQTNCALHHCSPPPALLTSNVVLAISLRSPCAAKPPYRLRGNWSILQSFAGPSKRQPSFLRNSLAPEPFFLTAEAFVIGSEPSAQGAISAQHRINKFNHIILRLHVQIKLCIELFDFRRGFITSGNFSSVLVLLHGLMQALIPVLLNKRMTFVLAGKALVRGVHGLVPAI